MKHMLIFWEMPDSSMSFTPILPKPSRHTMFIFRNTTEFMEFQIPGIPMVMMVTSRARYLHDPTQQDFINMRTLPIYICHTRFKF